MGSAKFIFTVLLSVAFKAQAVCVSSVDLSQKPSGDFKLFNLDNGRKIAYEGYVQNPSKPTLILMPGVYRGNLSEDPMVQELTRRRINWVSLHLSAQPMSVDRGLTAQATFTDITTAVFKKEVTTFVNSLCLQKSVYVPLSYSGSIGSLLEKKDTSLIIDTTPIGSFTEGMPDEGISYYLLNWWYNLNPFTQAGWSIAKENYYKDFWSKAVDEYIVRYPALAQDESLKKVAVNGYVSMTKAIEYFDMRSLSFSQTPRRVFILAEKEDSYRRQIQLQVLNQAEVILGSHPLTFILEGSSHNVGEDSPLGWATALDIATTSTSTPTPYALVNKQGGIQWLTEAQWTKLRLRMLHVDTQKLD